jgi:DUF1365 family protein
MVTRSQKVLLTSVTLDYYTFVITLPDKKCIVGLKTHQNRKLIFKAKIISTQIKCV